MPPKIRKDAGFVWLEGMLDGATDLTPLLSEPAPLRFKLGKLTAVSSQGIGNLLRFLQNWAPREFEFHEATPGFIDAINVLVHVLGDPPKLQRLKSLRIPYLCQDCGHEEEFVIMTGAMTPGPDGHEPPEMPCSACGGRSTFDGVPGLSFSFFDDTN